MTNGIVNESFPEGSIRRPPQFKPKQEIFSAVRFPGELVSGAMRGADLVNRFADRLVSVIGYRPYPGTIDVKTTQIIDIELYETKRISHVLMDGSEWIDLRLAPVKLIVKRVPKPEAKAETSGSDSKDVTSSAVSAPAAYDTTIIDCWLVREERGLHYPDVLELLAKEQIMKPHDLKLGDKVEVELYQRTPSFMGRLKKVLRIFPPGRRL